MSGIVGTNAGRSSGKVGTVAVGADAITGDEIADDVLDSEHYVAASIDNEHLADNAVGLAEMAGGTDGNIISYDASGDPVAIATGNDGQVLTSAGAGAPPVFEDAAGGGAWTLIGTAVASDSASLDITGLSSTYDTYACIYSDIKPANNGPVPKIRLGDSSGFDSGSSDYSWVHARQTTNGTAWNIGSSTTSTSITAGNIDMGNDTGRGFGGSFYIYSPTDSSNQTILGGETVGIDNDGYLARSTFFGRRNDVIAHDRVQLLMSSGNITSGRFTVWGIKHS